MADKFLYEELYTLSKHKAFEKEIPIFLKDNLNPKFELRPYQKEAFSRFFYHFDSTNKEQPLHLLFNMATGSGKTLIMAGLILYLYERGYRNFLFFVNSTNIIKKTKDNFLNPLSSKYLFKENIHFDSKRVTISSVNNFESINKNDINICFTTVQKLHSDLNIARENSLTYEDFKNKKIVLLADEAHHLNKETKTQKDMLDKDTEAWESTVQKIFTKNKDNLLLEFTATLDYAHSNISNKYKNKVLYKYDLVHFRDDKYSKEVCIVQADFQEEDRILQALILNQYKQEVAEKYRISLKPVILFKAQKTISQSRENKEKFHKIIESLTVEKIRRIKNKSNLEIVQKAFKFFEDNRISLSQLVQRLSLEFQKNRCLSVNEEKEKEKNQILLNNLEDKDNNIRAIFAVEKLNEGWDVLNLFDIVRCYETRDSGKGRIGKTTMREAQLIGRGARYFPFVIKDIEQAIPNFPVAVDNSENPYKRKFDNDLEHELRVLEELHYHSINDSKYIYEIRSALIEIGIMDEKEKVKSLKLKENFKKTEFYNKGIIYKNKKVKNDYKTIKTFANMKISQKNYQYHISTGRGLKQALLQQNGAQSNFIPEGKTKDITLKDIPHHIIQNAISKNPFFSFYSLKKYYQKEESIRDFIEKENYLGGLSITFNGLSKNQSISNEDKLFAMTGLLREIEKEIKENITEYKGTEKFHLHTIKNIFKDKKIKVNDEKGDGDEHFVSDKDWYVFKANYGTSEEKAFVRLLDRQMDQLKKKYDEIYLIRNEKHFKIHNFKDGQGFEPDFVLFLRQKTGAILTYQMFIEPKGKHLKEHDKWKEDFLKQIREKFKGKTFEFTTKARSQKYRLTGVPFYNNEDENQFKKSLYSALNESTPDLSNQKTPDA